MIKSSLPSSEHLSIRCIIANEFILRSDHEALKYI